MTKNILLMLVSTFITLLFLEVILRFFYADYLYTGSTARSLYYSIDNLSITEDNKTVHYSPNTDIRSIAIYYNQIEYDTHHHANNFGFLSDKNYTKDSKPGVIFVGDSFTAGVGSSSPWIPKLNQKYSEVNLYSLGVTGTGIWNFYNTFNFYKDKLNFDTIVIVSISDDLRRHIWIPQNTKDHLLFYETKLQKAFPCATLIDYNLNAKTLLNPEEPYVYKAFKVLKSTLTAKTKQRKARRTVLLTNLHYDMTYVKKIKALADTLGKKVIFLHIPEKGEMLAGYYRCIIQKDIEKLGIEYHPLLKTEKFNLSMYHKHDGHPNDKGYAYISSIVEDILKLKK